MKLYRYTKKPIPFVVRSACLGLFIFDSPNIVCGKLVSIDKPKSITEVVIDSFSFSGVF